MKTKTNKKKNERKYFSLTFRENERKKIRIIFYFKKEFFTLIIFEYFSSLFPDKYSISNSKERERERDLVEKTLNQQKKL